MATTDLLIHNPVVGCSPRIEEELPMTIQVGMVGTDGILIAGDTRWTNTPMLTNRLYAGGRYGFNSSKIKISPERGIAISQARDMEIAGQIADQIIAELKDEDFRYPASAIAEIAAKMSFPVKEEAHCLVVLTRPMPQLFHFLFATVQGKWAPICQPMETIAIAGDNVNASIFWAERYYQRIPIEQLVPLAAHLVVCARKLNTGTISGLEIVLCTPSGIHRLSDESIHELEVKADEWDRNIGDLFLDYRQQFTYAPDVIG
jgi:hypothetical protein